MQPRILIVDDHELTLLGLKNFILQHYPGSNVDCAQDGESAYHLASSEKFDLIILDICIPKKNGIHILRTLRQQGNEVPIIILSGNDEAGAGVLACRLGAWAFVRKDSSLTEVREAIDCVLGTRQRYFGPSLNSASQVENDCEPEDIFNCLSDQEFQVFRHIALGRGSKEVADLLGISYKTVRTYRNRVFKKLGLKSDAHAVHLAVKIGVA